MNYLYPKTIKTDNIYTPHVIDDNLIENIKVKIEEITGCDFQVTHQTEYFYRDLVKVELNRNELFLKKKINARYNEKKQHLYISYDVESINSNQFPNLNSYHHVETKEIWKCQNILLIKNNTRWTICIEYNKLEQMEKSLSMIKKLAIL